ncbi:MULTISPECIES: CotH kinase family protein [Sorangium]|uniref:Secreted protein n=1 Tax=Sorangium cellulosum TaxID=56 RepID=A0A4P2QX79_SORCE|nr:MULTISPECIES: CotH kinase family protein [Sorangium]AUX35045.1 hypothetical protein SOCE836_072330 [Sorangium cellulosum]WCQ94350.1 hypothetical protein NQZ70_07115 [Sorangium sp. Soce836]
MPSQLPSLSARSRSFRTRAISLFALSVIPSAILLAGCADPPDTINNYYYTNGEGGAGGDGGDRGDGGDGGAPAEEFPGAPVADTEVADHALDVFGAIGNRYWLAVSKEQLELMNEGLDNGPIPIARPGFGDIYSPTGEDATFVDHLWVTTAGAKGKTADYGKVQVGVAGQSTLRPWTKRTIPNLNVDADEFVEKQRLGGFEHLRFNNGQVGTVFRERLTLELYARLDYPAPLTNYAWISSNVWGPEVSIPYIVVERYKKAFCARLGDKLGGGCANMWEFAGDFAGNIPGGGWIPKPIDVVIPGGSIFDDPATCQLKTCDNTRAKALEQAIAETPPGEGFKAALEGWIDWPAFHRFQCLSWVLATGDDAIHNSNNVVLVERSDGLFQYLPYSVDISLGQSWYPLVPLAGANSLARGCQSDTACWADTIAMCEDVIEDFAALDPNAVLKGIYEQLSDEGMLRPGDEERYAALDAWLTEQLKFLPEDLERNREQPQLCVPPQVDCGGYCGYPQDCGWGVGAAVGAGGFGEGGGGEGGFGEGGKGVGGFGEGGGGVGGFGEGGGDAGSGGVGGRDAGSGGLGGGAAGSGGAGGESAG